MVKFLSCKYIYDKLKQTQFCTFDIDVKTIGKNADIHVPSLESNVIPSKSPDEKATVGETLEQHNAAIREPWNDATYPEDSTPALYCGTNYTNSGLNLASGQFSIGGYIGASSPSFSEIENFGSHDVWLSKATSNLGELEYIYYSSVCNGTDFGKISATFYYKNMYKDITSKTTNIILKKEYSDKLGDVSVKQINPEAGTGLDVSGNYRQYAYDDTLLITNTTEVNARPPDSKQVPPLAGLGNAALIHSSGIRLGDNIPVFMVPVRPWTGRERTFSSIELLEQSKSYEQVIRIEIDEDNSKITTFSGKSLANPVFKQRLSLEFTKSKTFADALTNNDSTDITSTANGLTQILRSSDGQTIMLAYKEAKDVLGSRQRGGMSSGTLSLYDVNSQLMKVYGICDIGRLATTILKCPIIGIKVKLEEGKTADDYLDNSLNGYADISSSHSSTGDLIMTITEYESFFLQ